MTDSLESAEASTFDSDDAAGSAPILMAPRRGETTRKPANVCVFDVEASTNGRYEIAVEYTNGSIRDRELLLEIDGEPAVPVVFASTGGWNRFDTSILDLDLRAGLHRLSFHGLNHASPEIREVKLGSQTSASPDRPLAADAGDAGHSQPFPNFDETSPLTGAVRSPFQQKFTLSSINAAGSSDETAPDQDSETATMDTVNPTANEAESVSAAQVFEQILVHAEIGQKSGDGDNDTLVRDASNRETPGTGNLTGLRTGFTGTGYVDFGNDNGDAMTYTIGVPVAGSYEIHIRYASSTNRPVNLVVNTGTATSLPFASTDPDGTGPLDGFNNWLVQKATVQLQAGPNTIALVLPGNGPNIDSFVITEVGGRPNFPPTVTERFGAGAFSVTEGALAVGTLVANDSEGDAVTFSLGSARDSALFTIDAQTGALSFKAAPDFESAADADRNNEYLVEVVASDGVGSTTSTVAVKVVNDVATSLALTAVAFDENVQGAVVAAIEIDNVDAAAGDFTLSDPVNFRVIVGGDGKLKLALAEGVSLDAEAASQPSVTVTAGSVSSGIFTPQPTDVDDGAAPEEPGTGEPFAPIYLQGEDAIIRAGSGAATRVLTQTNGLDEGAGSTTNRNDVFNLRPGYSRDGYLDFGGTGDAVSWTVTSPQAGTFDLHIRYSASNLSATTQRKADLEIAGGAPLKLSFGPTGTSQTAFDNWNVLTVPVTLVAGANPIALVLRDGNGPNVDALAITATGAQPDFAPRFTTKGAFTVAEGATQVGILDAADVDENTTDADDSLAPVSFAITGGADGGAFTIDAETGQLSLNAAADFETKTVYDVVVSATDSAGGVTEQSVRVTVTDDISDNAPANTAPVFSSATREVTIDENTATVATIAASDADGDAVTYSVSGGADAAAFDVDAASGALSFKAAPDFEAPASADGDNVYEVAVTADDGEATSVQTLAVTVADVDETPAAPFEPIYVQAENGTRPSTNDGGTTVRDAANPESGPGFNGLRPGFSGTGYLDFGSRPGDRVVFSVDVSTAGTYDLSIRYASNGDRPLNIEINEGTATSLTFTGTDTNAANLPPEGFDVWSYLTVPVVLAAGVNTVALAIPQDRTNGPNIDRIEIAAAGTGPSNDVTANAGGDLALTVDASIQSQAAFTVAGLDADVKMLEISVDGGSTFAAVNLAGNAFTLDLSAFAGEEITAILRVTDAAGNRATTSVTASVPAIAPAFAAVDDAFDAQGSTDTISAGELLANDSGSQGATLDGVTNANGGTAVLTNGGVVVSLDEAAYAGLDAGDEASVSFDYTATADEASATATATVTFTGVNDAPVLVGEVASLTVAAGQTGSIALSVTASDPDADAGAPLLAIRSAAQTALPAGIALVGSSIAVGADVPVGSYAVELYASDEAGEQSDPIAFTVTVEAAPVEPAGPTAIVLAGISGYSSQDRPQDGGVAAVSQDGASLTLDGNFWKRADLGQDYAITASTQLVLDVAIADNPEIVAVGFDLDANPFDADRSLYQLGGGQTQGGFVDLRGSGTPNADGTTRFTIDLGVHAGTLLSSLVFVNDDDSKAVLGSSTFSNMQFVEKATGGEDENTAPVSVGGGIADRTVLETGAIEIDLPFADADGDDLTYTFTVADADGSPVTSLGNLAITGGTLAGDVASLGNGVFTVTVTASDGAASTSDAFTLTVQNVNDAPVADDVALEPYFASVGDSFAGFDVNEFAQYFSDSDGDALDLSVVGLPEGLTINEEGYVSGTPSVAGSFEIKVRATDPSGLFDEITLELVIEGPELGDVVTIEAEASAGLSPDGFFATGTVGASGGSAILLNLNDSGSVSADLSAKGLAPGYYTVTAYVYDETDGASTFSLTVGNTPLLAGGSGTVTLNDAGPGSFVNPSAPRGTAAQPGNLKAIAFDTVVSVGAGTVMTLDGRALGGESLRVDRFEFTRVAAPDAPPADVTLTGSVDENAAGAVVGVLAAVDAENAAITFTTSDARFLVVENEATGAAELTLADGVSLDHETDDGTSVAVTATDAAGGATTVSLTLAVNDLNEAPTLAAGAAVADQTFETGTGGAISLAVLGAADQDEGDTATLTAQLAGGGALPAGIALNGTALEVAANAVAGTYEVEVFASDGELDSDSVSFTVTVEEPATVEPFQPITIQAESGVLTIVDTDANVNDTTVRDPQNRETRTVGGVTELYLRPDFTGTGYLDFGDTPGDKATYGFDVSEAGTYDISVRYASSTARPLALSVNGAAAVSMPFPSTDPDGTGTADGFDVWAFRTITVELKAGANSVSFAIPAGAAVGPNLDRIEITQGGTGPIPPADTSADADNMPLALSGPVGELNETQAASINFNLAGRDEDIVKVEISFDGGLTRVVRPVDADGDFVVDGSALAPGPVTATVYVTDAAGNVASTTMDFVVADPDVAVAPFTIQAEDETQVTVADAGTGNADTSLTREVNAQNPDAFGSFHAGATGNAYMDFGSNAGDAVIFNVDAPAAGTYLVTFRYANGAGVGRPLELSVNGGAPDSLPFASTGTGATAWANWQGQTVELTLNQGANAVKLAIPAGAVNGPNIDEATFVFQDGNGGGEPVPPFSVQLEAETFTPDDTTGTGNAITQARTVNNKEPTLPLLRDANADGLWDGFTGGGYLDMGGQIGDAATFNVTAPDAGTYTFTFRYSNGGGGTNGDRPMLLTVGGETATVSFPGTGVNGWDNWQTATVEVELAAGVNAVRLANTVANGPNIDNVVVSREGSDPVDPVDPREQLRFAEVVKINFQPGTVGSPFGVPAGYTTPAGFEADTGAAFGARGNGFSYGWVTEASVADGTANGTIGAAQPDGSMRYKNDVPGASDLQKTYAHFEYPGAAAGSRERAWEMDLANGTYELTLSIGDTGGPYDSRNLINVEGRSFFPGFTPVNLERTTQTAANGEGFRSSLVTGIVQVTDGRLTIDSIGGVNTEIQYLEVERVPDLTPTDNRTADLDYSFFTTPEARYLDERAPITIGADGTVPLDINPLSSFVVGINLQAAGNRGPNISEVDNIKLVETLTGASVAINVQISGGADSLTIRPLAQLKENTSYTLKVEDVLDLGSITDADAPLRQFQDLTTTFVTGEAPEAVARTVAFTENVQLNGFADGAGGFTSLEFGPDGKLYVATITGQIHRWSVNSDGTIDKASQETFDSPYLQEFAAANEQQAMEGIGRRGIVGLTFDPNDPNTIWITDNYPIPREAKAFDTPEFSGRVSKVTLGEGGSLAGATAEAYITGLPRSGGDHVTNSLEFRANPDAGQAGQPEYLLYLTQGSNSAAGERDGAWGNRPEKLLNAAILEIDPTRDAPQGGFNVRTEPFQSNPTVLNPAANFNDDGTYPNFYNPFAADAVLKIFGTGVRNAYDLVWHSNGQLYVPTNGTAGGAIAPDDPDTAANERRDNIPTQVDFLFTVEEGKYYGHPNPLRDEYILNGGNPTGGTDRNEVGRYAQGQNPDANYDIDGTYSLGFNKSPNGAIEYKGEAFGTSLKGNILIAQFSTGDNVRSIQVDASGKVIGDDVLRRPNGTVIDTYIDPLDIIENPVTGQLYLMTLNRGTGASQLVLLTPAPGGVVADTTADVGNDLAITPVSLADPAAATFRISGLDADVNAVTVSFGNGAPVRTVTPVNGQFTADLSSLPAGAATATLVARDAAGNSVTKTAAFTIGGGGEGGLVSLVTVQAEDRTPGDGTAVTVATGTAAEIQIRDASNPETSGALGLVGGLRPGAFGTDGNTNNGDGTPGGYADFGFTNADFVTFAFTVPADQAGAAVLRLRYANGDSPTAANGGARPLQVEVNGSIVTTNPFLPGPGATTEDRLANWQIVEIPASLLAGGNTVTLRSTNMTGPNVDQLEVLVPADGGTDPEAPNDGETVVDGIAYVLYEAENAEFAGPAVVTEERNQSGEAFVDFVGTADQSIEWTISVGAAGTYGLDVLYALGAGKPARPLTLTVNGQGSQTLPFTANSNAGETIWGPQSVTLDLVAGTNTVTITAPGGVGPNIDALRVTKQPVSVFEPDFAAIAGSGRIELETQNGSANTVNGSTVDFYFTIAADGIYKLDVAANAGATNGQGLTWYLNGVEIDDSAFPGAGASGEESIYLELTAGTQNQLRIVSDAPGANGIDYLDIAPAPGNANADIAVQSLDPAYLDNRLHFSFLENPDAVDPDAADRDFKDSGTVRITNTGTETLTVTDYELDGPFVLANPAQLNGLSIAAGQSVDVTVLFNRAAYTPPTTNVDGTSTVFTGQLQLITNDADSPVTTVDLAGFWQARDEGGQEPNVNEIWRIFGFGNVIEGLRLGGGGENSVLSTNDVFAKTDETEVLSPYWQLADGVSAARITQIAAFHGPGGADIGIHNPTNKGAQVQFWNHEGTDNQRLLPNAGNDTSFATRTFTRNDVPDGWLGTDMFGIRVAGLSTDPTLNPRGNVEVPGAQQGHTVKMFQALDAAGNAIANTFLGIMDYTGINYDYNDNLFVIEGVAPVGFGQTLSIAGLDDAAADERLVFTNIDNPANAQQNFRNEATLTISNPGFAALAITGIAVGDPDAFEIVGSVPTSIAAGGSANVTVRFIGSDPANDDAAVLFNSTLTITSNDVGRGQRVIQLAGLAQNQSENGEEPTVAQVVEAFGYSTDVAQGQLSDGGLVETVGDEVLMPYMLRLDASTPVQVIQLAAFLQQNNVARLGFHGLNSAGTTPLFAQDDQEYQTVLPSQLNASGIARGTINQDGPFGLFVSVDNRPTYASWSDPVANREYPAFNGLPIGDDEGHLIRFFKALDANGAVIEGTFIGIQDYPGAGNYDYNDHMFVIKNVKAYELTTANDANNNEVNDALELDADNDGTVNFFDGTTTPPTGPQQPFNGTAPSFTNGLLTVDASNYDTGAQGVAYNDNAGRDGGNAGFRPGDAVEFVGAGNDIGHIRPGEWIEYTINVPASGVYDLSLLAKTPVGNATVAVSLAGGATLATVALQDGGTSFSTAPFQATAPTALTLPSGEQTIRLTFNGTPVAGSPYIMDLRSFALDYREPPVQAQSPFGGTAPTLSNGALTVDASNYDNGGQGVAYNDAAGLQGGTNGGRAGSAVEATGGGDIGWIATGDWVEYTIDVASAGRYDLDLSLSNGNGTAASATVAFYRPGEASPYATSGPIANPSTGSWTSFANRSVDGIALEDGEQVVRVTFTGGQDFRSFTLTPPANPQQPFGGTAPSFSNGLLTVDASNYDQGGQGVAYNDNPGKDGGNAFRTGDAVEFVGSQNDIGYVLPGEWVEYTVNVPQGGAYELSLLAKTPLTNASIAVSLAGGAPLATVALPDGGSSFANAPFQATAPVVLSLPAGQQTLRLTFSGTPQAGSPYVLDLRSFTLDQVEPSGQAPFGGTAHAVGAAGLTLDAVSYDNGGQGVAYNDDPGLDGGTNGGRANSGVEVTAGGDIGWIESGQWVEYTINVGTAGTYDLSFLSALGEQGGGRSITASFEQNGATYRTASPAGVDFTGSWTSFAETDDVQVQLNAGVQVMRLTFNGGSQDLAAFTLAPAAPAVNARPAAVSAFLADDDFVMASDHDASFLAAASPVVEHEPEAPAFSPVFAYDLVN